MRKIGDGSSDGVIGVLHRAFGPVADDLRRARWINRREVGSVGYFFSINNYGPFFTQFRRGIIFQGSALLLAVSGDREVSVGCVRKNAGRLGWPGERFGRGGDGVNRIVEELALGGFTSVFQAQKTFIGSVLE